MQINEFQEQLDGSLTMVDVWAPWCGPCRTLTPIIEKVSEDKNVKLLKVNADESGDLTTSFGVRGIPTVIFFKGGQEVDKLKEELKKLTKKEIQINIFEVKRPELDARLVADAVARQLEARISFRRAIKMAIAGTMRLGAEGIKIKISGRLNGAEMARSEMYKDGRTPLHTFRADIDYAVSEAHTTYGRLGIKVWICRGEVYGKRDLSPNVGMSSSASNAGNSGSASPKRKKK